MSIFETRSYKAFLRDWLARQPRKGRGMLSRMAEEVSLSPGMLSQILSGDKHLSPEAACDVAKFVSLSEEETDYFLLLVSYERAGSHTLRQRLHAKVLREQKKASEIASKVKADTELSDQAKAVFYSHWLYSGIRNMSACPDFQTVEAISGHLKMPTQTVQRVVDFLLRHGLCAVKKGRLGTGPRFTHIGNQTSLVGKHHQNWRLHGFTKMIEDNDRNVFFTSPMSLSRETAEVIRAKIPTFIEDVKKLVGPSPSEVVRCLSVDWFEY